MSLNNQGIVTNPSMLARRNFMSKFYLLAIVKILCGWAPRLAMVVCVIQHVPRLHRQIFGGCNAEKLESSERISVPVAVTLTQVSN